MTGSFSRLDSRLDLDGKHVLFRNESDSGHDPIFRNQDPARKIRPGPDFLPAAYALARAHRHAGGRLNFKRQAALHGLLRYSERVAPISAAIRLGIWVLSSTPPNTCAPGPYA